MRRRTPKTKKVLDRHVKRQAYERFGLKLTDEDLRRMANLIKAGKEVFVYRQSLIVTRWKITWKGLEMAAVYDTKRHAVRTVMPVEYLYKSREDVLYADLCQQ